VNPALAMCKLEKTLSCARQSHDHFFPLGHCQIVGPNVSDSGDNYFRRHQRRAEGQP